MEFSILNLAASGVRAQQTRVDAVGHNLANLQTSGFRAIRPELVDLPAQSDVYAEPSPLALVRADDPNEGVTVAAVTRPDLPGSAIATGGPLDVALPQGVYLAVRQPDGTTAYTRDGHVGVGEDGMLAVGDLRLATSLRLDGTASPSIDERGQVVVAGPDGAEKVVGSLPLVTVQNPEQLAALGDGLFGATPDSGAIKAIGPAQVNGLIPGAIETSNVQIDGEITHMVRAQRAYQANVQMIHTWDELTSGTIQELGRS